jgi:ABC-type sugar transport system permease subunit
MSTVAARAWALTRPRARFSGNLPRIALRLLGLALVNAFALWFLYQLVIDGVWFLAVAVALITAVINIVFLREELYPLRWLSPSLVLMILMVVYPLLFTVYTAFTNYSDTQLLTKQQAIRVIERERFLPKGGATYRWTAFRSPDGEYVLWLLSAEGQALLARPREPVREVSSGEPGIGPLDEAEIPQSIEGYERLSRVDSVRYISELADLEFGEPPNMFHISSLDKAAQYQQKFVYDPSQDVMIDRETGTVYRVVEGVFTSPEGKTLWPAFQVTVGWKNFQRLFLSPALQGPLIRVFLWTVAFALLAVFTTFALGLFLSLVFNDPIIPAAARKLIRSFLLLPYAVPFFLSILIWKGMLNPHVGIINKILENLFGWSPPWLSDQWWAKVAILLVNLWLGFPYMMLITTGALQAIPLEIYEAAEIDGASGWQRFWHVTLPLLLVMIGPLLIFSFAFNFNNFNVIFLFNRGGPPMPNTPTPAGHTDILISYSYRLAFESGRGGDYGYAAAITIIIFLVLAAITLFQFRYARMWERISENV